jgi:hypothetical protein
LDGQTSAAGSAAGGQYVECSQFWVGHRVHRIASVGVLVLVLEDWETDQGKRCATEVRAKRQDFGNHEVWHSLPLVGIPVKDKTSGDEAVEVERGVQGGDPELWRSFRACLLARSRNGKEGSRRCAGRNQGVARALVEERRLQRGAQALRFGRPRVQRDGRLRREPRGIVRLFPPGLVGAGHLAAARAEDQEQRQHGKQPGKLAERRQLWAIDVEESASSSIAQRGAILSSRSGCI